jgi:hypothetical protein
MSDNLDRLILEAQVEEANRTADLLVVDIERLKAELADMLSVLVDMDIFFDSVEFDFRNGNVCSGVDEGEHYGRKAFRELCDTVKRKIAHVKGGNGMTHTPEPWELETTEDGDMLLVMDHHLRIDLGNAHVCDICHANAKLMRAAPELLAALEFYANEANWENDTLYYSGATIPDSSHCAVDNGEAARAAIAHAKGEADVD